MWSTSVKKGMAMVHLEYEVNLKFINYRWQELLGPSLMLAQFCGKESYRAHKKRRKPSQAPNYSLDKALCPRAIEGKCGKTSHGLWKERMGILEMWKH